jgi:hypothetical protein
VAQPKLRQRAALKCRKLPTLPCFLLIVDSEIHVHRVPDNRGSDAASQLAVDGGPTDACRPLCIVVNYAQLVVRAEPVALCG